MPSADDLASAFSAANRAHYIFSSIVAVDAGYSTHYRIGMAVNHLMANA